jgi:hypothetical protein
MADIKDIKKIRVGTVEYDISAKYIIDNSGTTTVLHEWQDILNLIEAGLEIVALDELPTADQQAYDTYHNSIVLIPSSTTAPQNVKNEFIIVKGGTASFPTFTWEQIGSTEVDLTNYAKKTEAAKPGTYTTSTPSANYTGGAGAQTITITDVVGAGTYTITSEGSYQKAATQTGSTGGTTTSNSGTAGGHTIDFSNASASFTGTSESITLQGNLVTYDAEIEDHTFTIPAHNHTVTVTANSTTHIATGVSSVTSAGGHSHSIDTHEHVDNVAIKGVNTWNAGTTGVLQQATTAPIISVSGTGGGSAFAVNANTQELMYSPTVSTVGVLSWSLASITTITYISGVTSTTGDKYVKGYSTTPVLPSLLVTTATVAGASSAVTLTSSTDGAHTHTVNLNTSVIPYLTGVSVNNNSSVTRTLTHTLAAGTVPKTTSITVTGSYQPKGSVSISGSQTIAAHSHTYVALPAHSHSIGLSTTSISVSGDLSLISSDRTVNISNHTHSLSNHTHSVTIPSIE